MDLHSHLKFRDQAISHGASWYNFARAVCGQRVKNGSLNLVTGCDKASSWSVQLIRPSSRPSETVTRPQPTHQSRCSKKRWPGQPQIRNQCVFVRGYNISVREPHGHLRRSGGSNVDTVNII